MNHDDPKLTAYVLDELEPAERAEIEQLLRDDPAALAEINASSAFAARLRREFRAEAETALTPEQRNEVLAAFGAEAANPRSAGSVVAGIADPAGAHVSGISDPGYRPRRWVRPLALAAGIAVVAGISYFALRPHWGPTAGREQTFAGLGEMKNSPDLGVPVEQMEKQMAESGDTPVPMSVLSSKAESSGGAPALPASTSAEPQLGGALLGRATVGEPVGLGLELDGSKVAAAGQPAIVGFDKGVSRHADGDADEFYKKGRYDLALQQTEQALKLNPSNSEARKMQEKVNQAIDDYAVSSYNETRSRLTKRQDLSAAVPAPNSAPASSSNDAAGASVSTDALVATATTARPAQTSATDPGAMAADERLVSSLGSVSLLTERVAPEPPSEMVAGAKFKLAAPSDQLAGGTTGGRGIAPASKDLPELQIRQSEGRETTFRSQPGAVRGFGGAVSDKSGGAAEAHPKPAALAMADATRPTPVLASPSAPNPEGRTMTLAKAPKLQTLSEAPAEAATRGRSVVLRDDAERDYRFERTKELADRLEPVQRVVTEPSTEAYDSITDNAFLTVRDNPLSTFSIDVDTASYSNVRRFLNQQRLPPKGAVRIEELINYFDYEYSQPEGDAPFSASMEVATCPWKPEHRLVRVGLKGRELARDRRPASNLVFLVDVSGSMQPENKLPLVKKSLRLLVDQLGDNDTVSMVVYAGASGCVLEPTNRKSEMRAALDKLESGGSTNGASGIQLAYQLAERSFLKEGTNRVILLTDGDFNVGVTSQSELVELIEKKAKSGVFLTVLGFGMDNLKDSTLEKLADKGNGNYGYIDTLLEGKKVLVDQMSGTLVTIAKDVKIQVEFNPAQVAGYRLIGYENRMLKKEDFNDDTKDAGEIGAGHTVTALYEVVPVGKELPAPAVDRLKYQPLPDPPQAQTATPKPVDTRELLTLKLRYKQPDGDTSKLLQFPLVDEGKSYERSSKDFRFAAAVASFGMLLRDSPHKGGANWSSTLELAAEGKGEDRNGYRAEFVGLVERAKAATR